MFMKKTFRFALMAALTVGLSFAATSCKDDDKSDNNNGGNGGNEVETIEGMSALEDDQLADLICKWTDTNYSDLTGSAWRSKTFDATVGLALDESRPGVRTMPVGTVEQADQYAVDCFNTLGIDSDNPNGFTFSDALVGTVSYSHGGSDASVLATINVDVKQIPSLQQIRLVKQLPENAGGAPYYELGDVVRYKNRLYICVSNHTFGQEARFITLNDQSQHSKGKFTWIGHDQDSVYNDEMAKAEVLADWLKNVVCDYNVWKRVSDKLTDWELDVRQVLPEDNLTRTTLINNIAHEMNYIPDIQKPNPIYEGVAMCIGIYPWFNQDSTRATAIIAPVGFLLANKLRYTAIKDKWVPYIFMAREGDSYYQRLRAAQAQEPSQYSDKKHFMWQDLGTVTITAEDSLLGKRILSESEKNKLTADKYHICLIGMHWTHSLTPNISDEPEPYCWWFVKDFLNHPNNNTRETANMFPKDWRHRNITSRSIVFNDNGDSYDGFTTVYAERGNF